MKIYLSFSRQSATVLEIAKEHQNGRAEKKSAMADFTDWIANFAEIDPEADSGIFRDFEPERWFRDHTSRPATADGLHRLLFTGT